MSKIATEVIWNEITPRDHFVQFYETDEVLVDTINGFVGSGLECGDSCVVIATEEHLTLIENRLHMRGINVAHAKSTDQYIALNAADTLSTFMDEKGFPDGARFKTIISDIINRAAFDGRHVRAFGEMVALLHAQGNRDATIRLEGLWNELGRTGEFSLFCAYPQHSFNTRDGNRFHSEVCCTHSKVIDAGGKLLQTECSAAS